MAKSKVQSVEPNVADFINSQLKSYKLDYKLEQESLNSQIDNALNLYYSKNGGAGGNRPDAKLLKQDPKSLKYYPVLIEYKGYKDKLIKLDKDGQIDNKNAKNEPNFKHINEYAVNGAVHYANAILHHTNYDEIIAIGVTGFKDTLSDKLEIEIGVYYVSKANLAKAIKVGEYSDLSFLKDENFIKFTQKLKELNLTPQELEAIKTKKDEEISIVLTKLNNDIYRDEKGLSENDRVYLVVATIIATLGVEGGKVAPLTKDNLISSEENGERDGDKILSKVTNFLKEKSIPEDKQKLITRTLANTLTAENLNKPINGESQLKRVFCKIVDDLGEYYKSELNIDFTGKLFNEMYAWLGFTQDQLNDVVLTPPYVATLLVKLARVNKDSFVWDFATGSAGLLIAAMNEMIEDAKNQIQSPDYQKQKIAAIKAEQLMGLEILPNIYMLAVLNMILMGDGSSNILNKDSLRDFDGDYAYGTKQGKFKATAFILNPPYSAEGNGMIFVQKALSMMDKGYAAIIIQSSAGSGKAQAINKEILKSNTLIASIKMPIDLFIGKSNVQTNIYVFKVGEAHNAKHVVKFINFSDDGYARANRKKAKSSLNLRDIGNAKARYAEVVDLVHYGKNYLNLLSSNDYFEGVIDPSSGSDWNQSAPIDTRPTLEDFKKTVSDYLAWEVSNIIKNKQSDPKDLPSSKRLENIKWGEFRIGDLFEIKTPKKRFDANKIKFGGLYPYVARTSINNGIRGYITENTDFLNEKNTISFGQDTATMFYQKSEYFTGDKIKVFKLKDYELNSKIANFLISVMTKAFSNFSWGSSSFNVKILNEVKILLPLNKNGEIDFEFMESFIAELEAERVAELEAYLAAASLKDYELTAAELSALSKFENYNWGEFRIGDLFTSKTGDTDLQQKDINGKGEYFLNSGYTNCGVNGKTDRPARIFSKNTITIDFLGYVFYRNFDYKMATHNHIFSLSGEVIKNEKIGLFLVASLSYLKNLFSFSNMGTWTKFKDLNIKLPITQNGEIDFEFMNNFIKAIKKLVIKDVVLYTDNKIKATKSIVSSNQ